MYWLIKSVVSFGRGRWPAASSTRFSVFRGGYCQEPAGDSQSEEEDYFFGLGNGDASVESLWEVTEPFLEGD